MALEGVPPYLREILARTRPEVLGRFIESADRLTEDDIRRLGRLLAEWLEDREYWDALAEAPGAPLDASPVLDTERVLDDELRVLTEALGDERLAQEVLVDFPARVTTERPDPQRVQQTVVNLREQVIIIQLPPPPTPPPPSIRLRVARVLRRVFKAAAGGTLIAADIVVPDPTILIIRIASIAGGADMILDAVAPELNR